MSEKTDYFFAELDRNLRDGRSPGDSLEKAVESYGAVFVDLDCPGPNACARTHSLKTWPAYFQLVLDRTKNFEIRQNDRDFRSGDFLRLEEYVPELKKYTGRVALRKVTCLVQGVFGLPKDVCVMSIE